MHKIRYLRRISSAQIAAAGDGPGPRSRVNPNLRVNSEIFLIFRERNRGPAAYSVAQGGVDLPYPFQLGKHPMPRLPVALVAVLVLVGGATTDASVKMDFSPWDAQPPPLVLTLSAGQSYTEDGLTVTLGAGSTATEVGYSQYGSPAIHNSYGATWRFTMAGAPFTLLELDIWHLNETVPPVAVTTLKAGASTWSTPVSWYPFPSVGQFVFSGDMYTNIVAVDFVVPNGGDVAFDNIEFEPLGAPPAVPEPSTLVLWSLLGSLGVAVGWRRRKAA